MVVPLVAFTQETFSGDVQSMGLGGLDLQFKPYQNEANVGFFWYGMV